jgi:hypothetical protein
MAEEFYLPGGLPMELFVQIAHYFPLKDCVRLESVNKKWQAILLLEWRRETDIDITQYIHTHKSIQEENKPKTRSEMRLQLRSLFWKFHPFVTNIRLDNSLQKWVPEILTSLFYLQPPHLKGFKFREIHLKDLTRVAEFREESEELHVIVSINKQPHTGRI